MRRSERRRAKVLDHCLDRILSGKATTEDCVREYPRFSVELTQLLSLASQMHETLESPAPQATFVAAGKVRILNLIRGQRPGAAHKSALPAGIRRLRPSLAVLLSIAIILFLGSGAGVAYASSDALPGEALYPVKLGMERGRLALSMSPSSDMELMIQFAGNRIQEIETLLEAGQEEGVATALALYEGTLSQLTSLADQGVLDGQQSAIESAEEKLQHHIDVLEAVLDKAPDPAKNAIFKAISRSSHSKEVLDQIQQGGSPSDLAPGKLRKSATPEAEGDHPGKGDKDKPHGPDKEKTPGPPDKPHGSKNH